ncbi:hypothetical protein AA12717_0921 [Gluconacetobacter sacchari DSM 12717]|uniref:Plasmid stabilization protein n=2 Tax=Gluconacetobacter sacchari TaxID=92759 RepID=A0A7W4IEW3_9PROT|nr:plasmid stabilization protein [Gluconacetobacter sacchari]MBB2161571.1 plasmid stabilization protein [Gluconacetobacter sacchari]GBQ21553.1 hypothetical protein AA12717_0921 [Gluconacetobacter sacchari DSM 12717]
MAAMTIRNIDEALKRKLRIRAATHGRSMEDEARAILRAVLASEDPVTVPLGEAIQRRFSALGGVELPDIVREPIRDVELDG